MEIRICSDCKIPKELTKENFIYKKNKCGYYFQSRCRKCRNELEKEYRKNYDKEKVKKSKKKWEKSEKGKICRKKYDSKEKVKVQKAKHRKKYTLLHPEKVRQWKTNHVKREVNELRDSYIRRCLTRRDEIVYSEITPELINLQRKQLKLKRDVNIQKNN